MRIIQQYKRDAYWGASQTNMVYDIATFLLTKNSKTTWKEYWNPKTSLNVLQQSRTNVHGGNGSREKVKVTVSEAE